MIRALYRADRTLVAYRLRVDANGHPAVSPQVREESQEGWVDHARCRAAKRAVVETRRCRQGQRVGVVSKNRAHEVIIIDHVHVETVRRHAWDDVRSMRFNRHGIIAHDHARSGARTVIARAVFLSRSSVIVARILHRTSIHFKFVTHAVTVRINEAVARAVVAGISIGA